MGELPSSGVGAANVTSERVEALLVNPAGESVRRFLSFKVYGMPGPQGSKSFKGMRGGHAIMVESSKKVRPWRQDVKAVAESVRSGPPLDGPLRLKMVFTLPKPASAPKRRQTWPMRTPDLSKLARSTEDAITDAGLWVDDARVVEYVLLAKRYPGEGSYALDAPGVWVSIEQII